MLMTKDRRPAIRTLLASGAGGTPHTGTRAHPNVTAVSDLRVALVHPYVWPEVRRGGERYVEDIAVFLANHNVSVEIVTGLQPTDQVIVAPSDSLISGTRVRIARAPAAPSP